MQLIAAAAAALLSAVLAPLPTARADGEVAIRGAYYKERSTRVQQPMVDATFDVGDNGILQSHVLVDAITSASAGSGAAGQAFTEIRYETGATYTHELDNYRLGGTARLSTEPDYKSMFAGVRGELDLAQRNTTVGAAFTYGSDDISNAGSQGGLGSPIEGTLDTLLGSASVTQVLSPLVVARATYDLAYLDGFQENPYRSVIAGGSLAMERVPQTRLRHAIAGTVRGFVPATNSTIVTAYRYYLDDWGMRAHTPEIRLIQQVVPDIDAHVRFRYHRQTGAYFFKVLYDSSDPDVEPFLTDDPKLGAYDGQTYSFKIDAKLSALGFTGSTARMRAEALVEYIVQNNRYGNAVASQVALTVPFDY